VTPAAIDTLLERLDSAAHNPGGYPPAGLPIWGDYSRRYEFRAIVAQWLTENAPEAQR